MFIVFALIDGHFLLTLELEIIDGHYRVCHPKAWARHFVDKIFVFIDALKYSAIPFFILLILSILIIQRVFQAQDISAQLQNLRQLHNYRQYSASSSPSCTAHSSTLAVNNVQTVFSSSNTRVGRRVTFMLLSVSIAFCVFSAPMSLMQIVQSIVKPDYHETPLAIGKAIAELCQYVNHSCNFFLYALTGRIFRREFVRVFFPTRFGGRPKTNAGIELNPRANLIPQAPPSSSHRGSFYSINSNRFDGKRVRSPANTATYYARQYLKDRYQQPNQLPQEKSPYLSRTNNGNLLSQFNSSQVNKSSLRLQRNSLANFWVKFARKKKTTIDNDQA